MAVGGLERALGAPPRGKAPRGSRGFFRPIGGKGGQGLHGRGLIHQWPTRPRGPRKHAPLVTRLARGEGQGAAVLAPG